MSPSTAPPFCSFTRTARMVPLMRPQTVTFCAITLPSIVAPSPTRRSEARNSPSIRPKTCAGPLHSIFPTIDMPEPMRESGPDFVVVGSGPDATCSTTVRDGCTVLPMSSSAFAAVFLSGSGALLLKLFNMLASPCGLKCLKLLLELARVRLELLFRRSLRFLRPAELTHAGRPQAEDPSIRKHTTPAPLL